MAPPGDGPFQNIPLYLTYDTLSVFGAESSDALNLILFGNKTSGSLTH